MSKIALLGIIILLFGLNNTSLFFGNVQIPIFRIFMVIFPILLCVEYLFKNRNELKKRDGKNILFFCLNRIKIYLLNLRNNLKSDNNIFSILMMFFWFAYAILSLIWVEDIVGWRSAINLLIIGVFVIVTFSVVFKTKRDIIHVYKMMGIIAIAQNIIGWFEVITGVYVFLPEESFAVWNGRPVSVFYNTNNFSIYLLFSVFILYACSKNSQKTLYKYFYSIGMISSAVLIFLTQSRGMLLSLLIAFFTYLTLNNLQKIKEKIHLIFTKRKYLLIAMVGMILLFIGFLFFFNNFFLRDYKAEADMVRINLVRNGFLFLFSSYGLGVGAGNIEYYLMNHSVYFIRWIPNIHNWWMEILTGYGVLVFAIYMIFYYKLIKNNFRKFMKSSQESDKTLALANICILISFILASTVPSTLMFHCWHWVYWGVVIAYQGIPLEQPQNKYIKSM